jgi:hypothetical protein
MLAKLKYYGLCSTCDSAPTCTLPKSLERPVICCEEFGTAPAPITETNCHKDCGESSNGKLGLCSNCAVRATCQLPKPDGAVWWCEEYC